MPRPAQRTDWPPLASDADLTRRALVAWFRTGGIDQPSNASGVVRLDGRLYVVLHNARAVLVVYRVDNDGQLRRLRRPPPALKESATTGERGGLRSKDVRVGQQAAG